MTVLLFKTFQNQILHFGSLYGAKNTTLNFRFFGKKFLIGEEGPVILPRSKKRPIFHLSLCLALLLLLFTTGCMTYVSMNGMDTLRAFKRQLRKDYGCITKIETKMGQDYHARFTVIVRRASEEEMDAIIAECQAFLSGDEFLAELEEDFPKRVDRGGSVWWPSLYLYLLDATTADPDNWKESCYYYGQACYEYYYHVKGPDGNYIEFPPEKYQVWHDCTSRYR